MHLWQRGVDAVKFSPEKRDIDLRCELLGSRPDRKIIGYVGRLANEKRIDDLKVLDMDPGLSFVLLSQSSTSQLFLWRPF